MLLTKFTHWDECSFSDYNTCCELYGFNSESSPRFLEFFLSRGADLKFLSFRRKGELLGAVCLDRGWLVNDHKNPKRQMRGLPIPSYSILPPFKEGVRCIAPFKTKSLNHLSDNFINSSFSLFSKRKAAYARNIEDGFSSKTRSTRNREIRKFSESGGSFLNLSSVASEILIDSYYKLHAKRWGKLTSPDEITRDFFTQYHHDFFGKMAMMNDVPVGFQLLISTNSKRGFFVDFINIGYDTDIKNHPIGTMMMWQNLQAANEQAMKLNSPLYYSYGMMSGEYKGRWCEPRSNGRTLTL